MAAGFNDLPMIVDEIAAHASKGFGSTLYKIMGGLGRQRARRDDELRKKRKWWAGVLSFGEVSVDEYISESGEKAKGGQLARMVDIPTGNAYPDKAPATRQTKGDAWVRFMRVANVR
jgi:putative DNA primase/helicase